MKAKDYIAQKQKELSKDVVVTKGKNQDDIDNQNIKQTFYKALATGRADAINQANDLIVKDYDAKGIEWRDEAEIKTKAQTVGTSGQGGLLVPTTISQSIIEKLYYISPMRQIATVIDNMPPILALNADNALPTTYWVGEGVAITESGSTFTQKNLVPYKLAGLDSFTSEVLADVAVNPSIQSVVEDDFATSLALAENAAFVSGDGSSKPYGFRSSDITPTTVTGNTTAGNLAFGDVLRLMQGIATAYRNQAVFVTSSTGLFLLWSLKDSQGRPLYLPDLTGTGPGTFMGKPIYVVDEIPTNLGTGTNETELWFANFKNYKIGNRGGLRVDYGTNGTDFAQDKITLRMIERVAGRPYLDIAWAKMNIK